MVPLASLAYLPALLVLQKAEAGDSVRAGVLRGGGYRGDLVGVVGHHLRRRSPPRRCQRESLFQSPFSCLRSAVATCGRLLVDAQQARPAE